jgi:DNA-binding LacI/PurR family transcriptional regulator
MTALQGPFYAEVLRGIEQKADESNYSLLLTTVKDKERSKIYLPLIKGRRMDGFLLINEHIAIDELNSLVKEDIAFVLLDRFFKEPEVNCVASDNAGGAKSVVDYLVNLGHRRIGFITGEETFSASRERTKGYVQALKKKKIPLDGSLVIAGSFQNGVTSGYTCAKELLIRTLRPTAIFAGNDEIAMGVFQGVREAGLKVPGDISVVGFDDAQFAAHLTPPLTTVKQFGYEIGYQSCEMLINILNKTPLGTNKIKIPTELIIRDSCRGKK